MKAKDVANAGRRNWLTGIAYSSMAATLGVLCYPVVRFLKPNRGSGEAQGEIVAPYRVNELRVDADGKWPPPFNFGGKPCLLVKTKTGDVKAFNAVCTHVDCTVGFRPEKGDIFCNCHNGVYDIDGRNVSGPPPRPLETYKVTLRGKPGTEEILVSLDD